jgi:hypothetical protein
MKPLLISCILLSTLSATAVYGRGSGGGMGGHHSASMMTPTMAPGTGGASGASPAAPGTNSSGTALSTSGGGMAGGPALGTGDPAVDREDRRVERMLSSICKGC